MVSSRSRIALSISDASPAGRLFPIKILDQRTRSGCPSLEEEFVLTASMTGAKALGELDGPHGETLVFSANHLELFMTLLKIDCGWRDLDWMAPPRSIEAAGFSFTFKMNSGKYNYQQKPWIMTSLVSGVRSLRNFPAENNLEGKMTFQIDGDIDQEQAEDLLRVLRAPFDDEGLQEDITMMLVKEKVPKRRDAIESEESESEGSESDDIDPDETRPAELIRAHLMKFVRSFWIPEIKLEVIQPDPETLARESARIWNISHEEQRQAGQE